MARVLLRFSLSIQDSGIFMMLGNHPTRASGRPFLLIVRPPEPGVSCNAICRAAITLYRTGIIATNVMTKLRVRSRGTPGKSINIFHVASCGDALPPSGADGERMVRLW
jgi:hypothetical protein